MDPDFQHGHGSGDYFQELKSIVKDRKPEDEEFQYDSCSSRNQLLSFGFVKLKLPLSENNDARALSLPMFPAFLEHFVEIF